MAGKLDWWHRGILSPSQFAKPASIPGTQHPCVSSHSPPKLLGFPRHLSQHVGGMVISHGRCCEIVPIENAAMEDRTVIEWDKDDLDTLSIFKVDISRWAC